MSTTDILEALVAGRHHDPFAVLGLHQDGRTRVAEQPTDRGRTYLSRELDTSVLIRSAHDFESGWLAEALTRETRW